MPAVAHLVAVSEPDEHPGQEPQVRGGRHEGRACSVRSDIKSRVPAWSTRLRWSGKEPHSRRLEDSLSELNLDPGEWARTEGSQRSSSALATRVWPRGL
jgi:hypothetical protein